MVSLTKSQIFGNIALAFISFAKSWLTWVDQLRYLSVYTLKYFTWCEGNNFGLLFNMRSISKALVLALKITTSVFVALLRKILLALSLCERVFIPLLTDLFISFTDCSTLRKQVSWTKRILWNFLWHNLGH